MLFFGNGRQTITKANLYRLAAKLLVISTLLAAGSTLALAQDSPGRVEVGGSLTALRTFDLVPSVGVGLEGDLNFGRHFALDTAIDWLPTTSDQGNTVIGLFGGKAGIRRQRLGYFVKVRPGFVTINNIPRPDFINVATNTSFTHLTRLTEPVLDLGGVVEYYPARHWTLRWDVGDMLIFEENEFGSGTAVNGQILSLVFPGQTTNNFRFSTGVHYRF
jgi:hypothetical protein